MNDIAGKKIHVIIDNITTGGGIERVCSVILPLLAQEADVKIIGLLDHDLHTTYHFPDIEIVALNKDNLSGQAGYLKLLSKAFKLVKKDRPDIVLYPSMGRLTVFAAPFIVKDRCFSRRTRHIACEHIAFSSHSGMVLRLKRITLPRYDRVIFLTSRDVEQFSKRSKLLYIPNPSPFTEISDARTAPSSRIAIGVGRLTYQKGFDLLIPAWKDFISRHPDWKLVIAGEGEDRPKLQSLIQQNGLENHCELHGNSHDIGDLYQRADIMLMPSRFEGLPMSLIEAQCHALPIVAFDCETGPREIVTHGKDGYLVPVFDQQQFSDAIENAIAPDKYADLSSAAAQNARRFDRQEIINHWKQLFASI
ncbi:glycosyltransferase family 4 protein [Kushneria indalinina]|uniref:Glycosyltransferase involved in cell wall biosynthesis n=1 Tax=Kushneria indalinina DSM 14324 TaxID=1122140 RepID=A0A3D9DT33_9GAMM|nr:glycosyltransferase family 4 protein [Kushneria indalinina]REC93918.1 glycosyltransferase involved in cell wall biosynthesis [Kushneria indalinina DSM 14324]